MTVGLCCDTLHEALRKALRIEALHEALREALHKALREVLRTEALHEAPHRVPAIFPIASTRASTQYTPYIATLFFTLPSLHPSYLGRHQNGSQQRTVTKTRRPFEQPASEHYKQFNQLIDQIKPEL